MAARKSSSTAVVSLAGPLRDEAATAAEQSGLRVGEWVERAVRKALEEGLEPAPLVGVKIGELEAMVRRVVTEELQSLKEALVSPEATAPSPPSGSAQSNLMRMRMRRHRTR